LSTTQLFTYTLHLADNALILGQRNAEWCGHGPVLEQDIAITNISLDLIGQARNLFQYAADMYNSMSSEDQQAVDYLIPRLWKTFGRELQEDDLAMLRDERQYLNLLITELPNGDWAQTTLRQFLFSAFQYEQYAALQQSEDSRLAGIAEKSLKEVAYHLRWSGEWVIRLGDGTEESHRRIHDALNELWMFTGEMFEAVAFETEATRLLFGADVTAIRERWLEKVKKVFEEATLSLPKSTWAQRGGKEGKHTEYLGYLLPELQFLQRNYPNAIW